jgi:hypothetical protein
MKLVEVVVLVGAQCVSPVQHAPHMTVAGKVPCAVLIHADQNSRHVAVTPAAQQQHPKVRLALARIAGAGTPQALPPAETPATAGPPVASADVPSPPVPEPQIAAAAGIGAVPSADDRRERIEPASSVQGSLDGLELKDTIQIEADPAAGDDTQVAAVEPDTGAAETPEPAKEPPKRRKTARSTATDSKIAQMTANIKTVCRYPRVAKWYKNKSGRLKYRCAVSGKSAKQGLY